MLILGFRESSVEEKRKITGNREGISKRTISLTPQCCLTSVLFFNHIGDTPWHIKKS